MGRRKKATILENPNEFDFEVRPINIVPLGFESEAIDEVNKVLKQFKVVNPLLQYVGTTDEATFFRFEVEHQYPPKLDLIGRAIDSGNKIQVRITTSCIPLPEGSLPLAELYMNENGKYSFNNWLDVELEFKGLEDPRIRRVMKYP
jgi:hypothetical protein